jgi:hypothetical protein
MAPQQLYRVSGKHGAVVRDGPETSSALVGTVPVLEVVKALDVQTNSKGVERVRIEGAAMTGWVSRRLLEKADAKKSRDLKIAVEWKDGDTLLKRLAVEAEPSATIHDVKLSLEAMTRVPAARQVLVKNDVELEDHEGVAASTLIMREEKPKIRTDLQTVRGGDALAAFLPPPAKVVEEDEAEPLHLRSHGTLCGGSFTTRKRTPFYAARHLNAKATPVAAAPSDDEKPIVEEARHGPKAAATPVEARAAAVEVDAAPSDDDDDIDEPIVEEVDRPRCQVPPPPPPPQKPIVVDVTAPKAPVTTQDVRAAGGPPPQKAVWNSKDTWEERDVTSWAVSRFTELLQEEVCTVSPAIDLKFRDVLRVVGDAQVVVFQRRTRYLFDFSEVELAWTAETTEGSPLFNGRCIIRDAASGAAAADLELETAFAPATDDEKAVNDFLRRRGEGLNLRASVGAVLERFEAEFVRLSGAGVSLAVAFPKSKRLAKR